MSVVFKSHKSEKKILCGPKKGDKISDRISWKPRLDSWIVPAFILCFKSVSLHWIGTSRPQSKWLWFLFSTILTSKLCAFFAVCMIATMQNLKKIFFSFCYYITLNLMLPSRYCVYVPWSHALLCQLLCWILCPVVSNYLTLIIDIHNLSTEDKFNLNILANVCLGFRIDILTYGDLGCFNHVRTLNI